jgi:anti-sigma-K factor RskA
MSAVSSRNRDRLDELLADEAAGVLESTTAEELAGLVVRHPAVPRDGLLQAAALAQVAFLRRGPMQRMPAGLASRLASQGQAQLVRQAAARRPVVKTTSRPASRMVSTLGWALAAMLAVAFVVVRNEPSVVTPTVDAVSARTSLLSSAPDVLTLPWAPPVVAGYARVTGDVVWSQSRQQGYLRLANLPVNDQARSQYQLWIVDQERDTHPVDGGVFNVSVAGEVIIPIQAKLLIRSPKAFAITAEQPGGVVVSAGPLLVVASI